MSQDRYGDLTLLGGKAIIPANPDDAELEPIPNPHPDVDYVVRLTCPELTSVCPITGQPDFGVMIVDYVPRHRLVESKSFKLFLASFRNHGTFHEDCTVYVLKRLLRALQPKYIRVVTLWNARGGIPIDVVVEDGELPAGCTPLPLGKTGYRAGRE